MARKQFKRARPFVGVLRSKSPLSRECFNCSYEPTDRTHGHRYFSVLGPFRTNRGAAFARANPCIVATVAEYEELARQQQPTDNSKGVRHGSRHQGAGPPAIR